MTTITAILEPSVDGTVRLAMPRELMGKKLRVTAQVELAEEGSTTTNLGGWDALSRIAARGNLAGIKEPSDWQREIRKDRPLPDRDFVWNPFE